MRWASFRENEEGVIRKSMLCEAVFRRKTEE